MSEDGTFGLPDAAVAAFDQSATMQIVVRGPELLIVAANRAIRSYLAGRQLVGTTLAETFGELAGQQVLDLYATCFATGEPQRGREWRLQMEDREGHQAEVYVDFVMAPWRDADGTVVGVIGQGTDVTEQVRHRHRVEAKVRTAQRQLVAARDVIRTLQDALLPAGLPVLPRVDLAASYLLAEAETAAGGDWFDAVPTREGRVALVVGDVVGHGVAASAVMGQLRATLAGALLEDLDPAAALRRLDRLAARIPEARAATVCIAVLDPATGDLCYCTAGHPPPLLLTAADDTTGFLAPSGAGPLGAGDDFPCASATLAAGDVLLLYTDGLIERPGRTPVQATVELVEVAASAHRGVAPAFGAATPAERVCQTTLEQLVRATGHSDDVTLMAAGLLSERVPALDVTLPAVPDTVRAVRRDLSTWLSALRLDASSSSAIQLAVGEAVTNAVEHAYPPQRDGDGRDRDEDVRVLARVADDGCIVMRVADRGRWLPPGPETIRTGRGRGLSLATMLTDRLTVTPADATSGTVVDIEIRSLRPARLLASGAIGQPPSPPAPSAFSVTVDEAPDPSIPVRVAGPVDMRNAEALLRTLTRSRAAAGTTRDVLVDLTEVTILASAGVQVLSRVLDDGEDAGRFTLYAPFGTPANHVLQLVGLPHVTSLPES